MIATGYGYDQRSSQLNLQIGGPENTVVINGNFIDENGTGIDNVHVTVSTVFNGTIGEAFTTESSSDGSFSINLSKGCSYNLGMVKKAECSLIIKGNHYFTYSKYPFGASYREKGGNN